MSPPQFFKIKFVLGSYIRNLNKENYIGSLTWLSNYFYELLSFLSSPPRFPLPSPILSTKKKTQQTTYSAVSFFSYTSLCVRFLIYLN